MSVSRMGDPGIRARQRQIPGLRGPSHLPTTFTSSICALAPASHKLTWTEAAKKGPQRVHFASDQLIVDFSLVFRRAKEALGENPGLVFPWKAKSCCC